tara:strand:+ start:541 stop:951 length:411 start_codon:yes stop_codon:yes gene_type:complete
MTFLDRIKKSEGYRARAYRCTAGYLTIGYGFAIKDLELSERVCDIIAEEKEQILLKKVRRFEWFDSSPKLIQEVVKEMVFNLGYSGFKKFKKTIYYLETEQYSEAADEMLDSLWARQVKNRAVEMSNEVRSCEKNR